MSQSQSMTTIKPPSWFYQYASQAGRYDEYMDEQGNIRPHWSGIAEKLQAVSPDSWQRRKTQLDKLIHEYGVTYNLYREEGGEQNAWSMDMLPQCLPESEILKVESMLGQRAFLLNLILQDVYGRQTLLKGGRIDPYLLYANPHYLRPCHGLLNTRQRHIHIYAADLVRGSDGNWQVLSDRVESAGGLGYAMENRALMSRVFPAIMTESGVKSLQPFTHDFSQYIESLAPSYVDNPNIALLSSGPHHETYFEQSYLSRNLGFHLVEGADLIVRNNHLYIKTVKGVKSVDVLLRRVNSSWCDPLELNNQSLLGIPGLVNTVRKGNLAVANSLGSGFAETTALPSMLPWFARNFLGENLDMPSVPTWWCGDPKNLKYVIDNLDTLSVKSTFRSSFSPSYKGDLLTKQQKSDLIARLKQNPQDYCAIDSFHRATIPISKNRQLEPRPYVMRVMMIPSDNGWQIMPGGLVRYPEHENGEVSVSMQRGAGSKDVWIIGDSAKKKETAEPKSEEVSQPVKARPRSQHEEDLPSRSADNLFWLGRYLERAESLARLLKTISSMLISQAGSYSLKSAKPFIDELPVLPKRKFSLSADDKEVSLEETEQRMLYALYDKASGESLSSNFINIERTASTVKERLSNDSWHKLLSVCSAAEEDHSDTASVYDDDVVLSIDLTLGNLSGFVGNLMENMTRSLGWYYLQIGRRVERALSIARVLRSTFVSEQLDAESTLEHLLIWGDSSITYRRFYLNALHPDSVLDVLCFDETNPRSLAYQTVEIKELFTKLPHHQSGRKHPMDLCALSLYSRIALFKSSQLTDVYRSANKQEALQFFDATMNDLTSIAYEIEQTYFAHSQSGEADKITV